MELTALRCVEITDPADLEAIYRLRYAIYVEEMRRPQRYADHAQRRLAEPLDETAIQLAVRRAGSPDPIGALRLNLSRDGGLDHIEKLYGLAPGELGDRSMVITRLVTRPDARGGAASAGLCLAQTAYRVGLRESVEVGYIDCNTHLVPFFEWLGFDALRFFEHPEYGDIAVMSLDPLDRGRLVRSNSPLLPILDEAQESRGALGPDGAESLAS